MALTKKGLAVYRCFLLRPAGALLAAGIDPIEVYKRCGDWAFDPAAEEIAAANRRRSAALTAGCEQEVFRLLRAMPDWAVPIWMRAGERLVNGVPTAKVWRLANEEFAVAQAAHQRDVRST